MERSSKLCRDAERSELPVGAGRNTNSIFFFILLTFSTGGLKVAHFGFLLVSLAGPFWQNFPRNLSKWALAWEPKWTWQVQL